jgi:CBS domain containing-hemolysin-like protein
MAKSIRKRNIFKLDDTRVSSIMTPRPDMFVLKADRSVNVDELLASGHSRIPIVEGGIDNVIGILNIRDLLAARGTEITPTRLRELAREPHFVPENVTVDSLLHTFRERREHIAVVIDEYGGVAGLVTLEDVLEEIVGEIIDETDTAEPDMISVGEEEWIVRARCPIDELNEAIPMNIPESHEYDTFSGFVLQHLQHIPAEAEEFTIGDFSITVKKAFGPKIREYLVRARPQES